MQKTLWWYFVVLGIGAFPYIAFFKWRRAFIRPSAIVLLIVILITWMKPIGGLFFKWRCIRWFPNLTVRAAVLCDAIISNASNLRIFNHFHHFLKLQQFSWNWKEIVWLEILFHHIQEFQKISPYIFILYTVYSPISTYLVARSK